jgi:large subunit ribosomal protein L13e
LTRQRKAAAIAPRPLGSLRPEVQCPTQRYNAKSRLGRGFTLEELEAAGVKAKYAVTVGIAVDRRRTNKCQESLDKNVARLKAYMSKLVIINKKTTSEGVIAAPAGVNAIFPIAPVDKTVVLGAVPKTEQKAFTQMRNARAEPKIMGQRIAVIERKKKEQ